MRKWSTSAARSGDLDLAGWLRLKPADKNAKPLADYLRSAKLKVAELDYLGLAFSDISLDLAATAGNLRIAVSAAQRCRHHHCAARPRIRPTLGICNSTGCISTWRQSPNRRKAPPQRGNRKQQRGPACDTGYHLSCRELDWGERQFGDVQATLVKLDDGISLKQLSVDGRAASASARKGDWRGKDAGPAHLAGTLTSSDVQETLKQLGYVPVIEAKTGRMDFDLSWAGAPSGERAQPRRRGICSLRSTRARSSASSRAPAGYWA